MKTRQKNLTLRRLEFMPRNLDSSRSPSLDWSVLLVHCERSREQHICLENYSKLAPWGWQKVVSPPPIGELDPLGGVGGGEGGGEGGWGGGISLHAHLFTGDVSPVLAR